MHFERYAASVVSIIGFNRRISKNTDPIITEIIAVMQRAAELNVPGKSFPMLMETFPCEFISPIVDLRLYFPGLSKFPTSIAPWEQA